MKFFNWINPPKLNCNKECIFVLQWHVSELCNLKCKHCYQSNNITEITDFYYEKVLDQYALLIRELRKSYKCNIRAMVTITGGEPLLYPKFWDICKLVKKHNFLLGILTNGTLLTKKTVENIKRLDPFYVQVSIDGTEEHHNEIRGNDAFEKAIQGLKELIDHKIRTSISFTAHALNYKDFYEVASLGAQLGVNCVWSDRLIPFGSGESMKDAILSPDQTKEYFQLMYKAKKDFEGKTYVKMQRALQFMISGEQPYQCTAGKLLLTLMPNGDIYPCRRLPVPVGNITQNTLTEIFFNNTFLKRLRDPDSISPDCAYCASGKQCGNGLKCLSFALYGDPFRKDPGCWN